uniref:SGNH hydrolase domain-containing protein n=1 Tax=Synechococcus sp. CCY 0621 TaxID=2815603 RepID=UPI0025711026
VLAVAAYGLVEQPVRRYPLKWWWETLLAVLAVGGLWLGIDALHHTFKGYFFVGADKNPVPVHEWVEYLNPTIPGTLIDEKCVIDYWKPYNLQTRTDPDRCSKPGRPGANEIFLLGDSHAQHLLPMLDAVTARTGQRITFAHKRSCFIDPRVTLQLDGRPYTPCTDFASGEMERALQRLRSGDIVMISSNLNNYLSSNDFGGTSYGQPAYLGDQRLRVAEVRQAHVLSMRAFAQRLAAKGIQLVLFVDNPPLARDMVTCPKNSNISCSPDPAVIATRQQAVRLTLQAAAYGLPNVHVFDPTPHLLDVDGRVRYRNVLGHVLYPDSHHLSVTGSRSLAAPFERFLTQAGLIPEPR